MDKEKIDALAEKNIGLVHACANKFRGRGIEYDELFSAGSLGLIKAARGFDESRGFAFSTYAVPVILGEIKRIFRDGGAVKIGRSMKEKARALMKIREEMTAQLQREPRLSELSEKMGTTLSETAELLTISMPVLSLTGGDDESPEKQIDVPVASPEERISNRLALNALIAALDEKDRKLIQLRYFKGLTQTKTAKELGMSQVQVSRREKAILMKMRAKM